MYQFAKQVIALWDGGDFRGSLEIMLKRMVRNGAISAYQMSFPSSELVIHFGSGTALARVVHTDGRIEMVTYGDQEGVVDHARIMVRRQA